MYEKCYINVAHSTITAIQDMLDNVLTDRCLRWGSDFGTSLAIVMGHVNIVGLEIDDRQVFGKEPEL